MTTADTATADMLRAYYAAWCTTDPDRIAPFFTPDATFEDLAFNAVFEGHDGVRTFAQMTFDAAPDFAITPTSIIVTGTHAAASWTMRGTFTNDLAGLPATGRPFEIRAASIIELRDGLIHRMTDYWNPAGLM